MFCAPHRVGGAWELLPAPCYCTNVLCISQLLARSGSLHHLRAAGCEIGDEGAVTIAQGLAVNRSLKTLDLGYVGDKAGELCPWNGVGTAHDSCNIQQRVSEDESVCKVKRNHHISPISFSHYFVNCR